MSRRAPVDLSTASCAQPGVDPEMFFRDRDIPAAKATCSECPVQEPCRATVDELEASLPLSQLWGVWAGEEPGDRWYRRMAAE